MATEMAASVLSDFAIDVDIDMDIGNGYEDDIIIDDYEIKKSLGLAPDHIVETPILSAPNDTSEANFLDPVPHKVHLRGLEHLTTNDIKAFAAEYYDVHKPLHIEWINDTSANLVYSSSDIAQEALRAFAASEMTPKSESSVLQTVPAKPFPHYPLTKLEIRLAVLGDKKQAGARERSRFYLLNPEYDPAERRKRANIKSTKTHRDRQDQGYLTRKFDEREQKKRERNSKYDDNFYDDNETPSSKSIDSGRQRKRRYENPSSSRKKSQEVLKTQSGKELFPNFADVRTGRLQNHSALHLFDTSRKHEMLEITSVDHTRPLEIKGKSKQTGGKELFPGKPPCSYPDTHFETDQTIDLFPNGTDVSHSRNNGIKRSPRNGKQNLKSTKQVGGFSIRGLVNRTASLPTQEFSIKGAASDVRVKELFPTLRDSSGREVLTTILGGRSQRRRKAEELFL